MKMTLTNKLQNKKIITNAIVRELNEELGDVKVKKIMPLSPIMNKSAGLTDETEQTFLVEIYDKIGKNNLEETELISCVEIVGQKGLINF